MTVREYLELNREKKFRAWFRVDGFDQICNSIRAVYSENKGKRYFALAKYNPKFVIEDLDTEIFIQSKVNGS